MSFLAFPHCHVIMIHIIIMKLTGGSHAFPLADSILSILRRRGRLFLPETGNGNGNGRDLRGRGDFHERRLAADAPSHASAENRSLLRLVMAIVDILFGLWLLSSGNWRWLILFMPYMFAAYILMRGGMLITFYFQNRAHIPSPHMYLLAAVGQILVGGAMFMMPLFAMKLFIYVAGLGLLWCGFTNFTAWREMQEEK